MIKHLLEERHSLTRRIIMLFAALVMVLFLTVFIFAYINTKSEYEKKLFYKMEIFATLVENQIHTIHVASFSKRYVIRDTDLTLILTKNQPAPDARQDLDTGPSRISTRNQYQVFRKANHDHNYDLMIEASRADVHRHVLRLTLSHILLPYLLVSPVFIVILFFLLLKNLKPLTLIEREISRREATDFHALKADHLPKELYSLVVALNQMFQRMQTYQNQQQQFIANAAHEMRSPITALNLQLQILKNYIDGSVDAQKSFNSVESGLLRIQNLVSQMMSLVHQESITSAQAYQRISLTDSLKQCIEQLYPSIENKDINLGIEQLQEVHVRAHPGQIDSIITNLLDNAIKYTPAEGSIHVSLFSNQTKAILRIEDSGSSIDAEEIEKVFQRFYRSPAHQQIIGSGLGLAIVKTALDQLHGRIILSQSDLGGLQVDVHLPASI